MRNPGRSEGVFSADRKQDPESAYGLETRTERLSSGVRADPSQLVPRGLPVSPMMPPEAPDRDPGAEEDPMRRLHGMIATAATALTILFPMIATAQTAPVATPASSVPVIPPSNLGDSPRDAVSGYLTASRAGNYDRAAAFLDLSELPPDEAAENGAVLARQLKIVLDRKIWIDVEAISDQAQGILEDGLPEDRERIGTIQTPEGPAEIRLRRKVDPETGVGTWRFSPLTVERIPALYAEFGAGPIGYRMPPALYRPRFFEIELWQWIGLIIVGAIAYGLGLLVTALFYAFIRRRARRKGTEADKRVIDTVRGQVKLVAALGIFLILTLFVVRLPIPARRVLLRIGEIFMIVLVTWTLVKLAGGIWERTRDRLEREDRRSAMALAVLGQRLTTAVLVILGVIVVLQQLGFNVTGILAGVGVGGVAIALAAQKTIANLFGGFSLATDQPVRLGDFCRFGDKSGWVEDIGMRSTRIRTMDRSIITVPNSEFAEVQLENLSMRDRIRLLMELGLRYETTPDQMRKVLEGLRAMLAADPRVTPEDMRVRFVRFGAYSLDIEVMVYVATSSTDEFMAIREELFLKMMDVVSASGTGLAFPSQTIYTAKDASVGIGRG